MKILFVGDVHNAASLRQALLRSNNHEIIHSTDDTHAIAKLLRKRYDWVIIDGLSLLEGKLDITRIIRMLTPEACRNRVTPVQANTFDAGSANHAKCGVEWSKNGVLQLHCGLHDLIKHRTLPDPSALYDAGAIIFEYHAPCKKERWRNG